MTVSLILLGLLIIMSGFFSATETAFTSLSLFQIKRLASSRGPRGKMIEKLVNSPDILLTTILIGNNLVNISASSLATQITLQAFGNSALSVMTGLLTLVILIFGEVTPKQIAMEKNEFLCLHTARIIFLLSRIFKPLVFFISLISNTLTRTISRGKPRNMFSVEHLFQLIAYGESEGLVQDHENQMVKNVFRIKDTPLVSIMTHRKDVFSMDCNITVHEALSIIMEVSYSRVPVFKNHPENIVGIVFTRTLMQYARENKGDEKVSSLMINPIFVPPNKKVHEMLLQFKKENLNIAIVLDEYGGLAGIVTREDVVEEVFGELYDEGEHEEEVKIRKEEPDSWVIQGDTPFYALKDTLNLDLNHSRKVQTLGGYLIEQIGYIPTTGKVIDLAEGQYIIRKLDQNKIEEICFKPINRTLTQ